MTRYLTVAAHPDDEVLGCGATMARLSQRGDEIHVVILGQGVMSRYDGDPAHAQSELDRLREQSREAAAAIGVSSIELEALPDNRFDQVALLDIVKMVETHINRLEPDVVFTHHHSDLNVDHRLTCQAVVTAARTVPGQKIRDVYSFEVPSATEWSFGATGGQFQPNMFVNVSETMPAKLDAMSKYTAEVRQFPHPRSKRALEATAARWGSVAGMGAAEAFVIVRSLRK